MKRLNLLFFALFLFLYPDLDAQNKEQARIWIDTLASPFMKGRGYAHKGDQIAADFLAGEMKKLGLNPFFEDKSFLQPFTHSVNVFENEQELCMGNRKLKPGKEFIISPFSGNVHGNFRPVIYKDAEIENIKALTAKEKSFKKKAIVLWPSHAEMLKKARAAISECLAQTDVVILINPAKLTWSVSDYSVSGKAVFEVDAKYVEEFSPDSRLKITSRSEFLKEYVSYNLGGYIEGAIKDTFILITAHYDHLGMMGSALFPGAGDNASGTAMMLDLASYYTGQSKPKYSLLFLAFAGEEAGLKGSRHFVESQSGFLKKIRFVMNIDLMGGGSVGSTVVNGTEYPAEFDRMVAINEKYQLLGRVKARGKAANSDHYWFSEKGVPAFFMYSEGDVSAYHDVHDTRENLPLTRYNELFLLIRYFIDGF
jgi:hypothetical protein